MHALSVYYYDSSPISQTTEGACNNMYAHNQVLWIYVFLQVSRALCVPGLVLG